MILIYVGILFLECVYTLVVWAVVICELEDGTRFEQLIFIGLEKEIEMFRCTWKRHVQDKLWC